MATEQQYWIFEYIQVALSYGFLMFVWPQVVFAKHLKRKKPIYRFSFCAVVQPVLVNTVVLGLGLIHLLNRWTICIFFYGIFLMVLYRRFNLTGRKVLSFHDGLVAGGIKPLSVRIFRSIRRGLWLLWRMVRRNLGEYIALGILLLYALIYFSWGPFQSPAYGTSDMYVHHSWIYGLVDGKPFFGGVYPEAMHCFIYCQHMLWGTSVHSIQLFFGSIHTGTILLSACALFRELFRWKYSPIFAILLFLIIKVPVTDAISSMSRMQWALPQEFGMTGQFLCPLYLVRYLKRSYDLTKKWHVPRRFLNSELFLFAMALAQTITAHFYATIMAFYICLGIAAFYLRKVFTREKFLPLLSGVLCGLFIAAAPMMGALASGIPFQSSIGWALGVMKGDAEEEAPPQEQQDQDNRPGIIEVIKGLADKCAEKIVASYSRHTSLFGESLVNFFIIAAAISGVLSLILGLILPRLPALWKGRLEEIGLGTAWLQGYLSILAIALIYWAAQAAPALGLVELISSVRLCTTELLICAAVMMIPLDILFALAAMGLKDGIWQAASYLCMGGIVMIVMQTGNYHSFLYYYPTRYRADVETMGSIINHYDEKTYTVVSPTDGIYQLIESGWHEELLRFVEEINTEQYTLPTEHIFIFVEKKPLRYSTWHTFQGPNWLAQESEGDTTIWKEGSQAVISQEAASKRVIKEANLYNLYKNLDTRTIIESKAYYWCQRFSELYPNEMKVYYEDEVFVCYYFRQEPHSPYNLAIDYENE